MITQMSTNEKPAPVSTSWPPYVDEHDCTGWNWPDEVELDAEFAADMAELDEQVADQEEMRRGY